MDNKLNNITEKIHINVKLMNVSYKIQTKDMWMY